MYNSFTFKKQIAAEKKQALELNNENRTLQQKVKQFQETITLLQNEVGQLCCIESYGSNSHIGFVPYHVYHFKKTLRAYNSRTEKRIV